MTDTIRTLAALQALLADNASGDISPQDTLSVTKRYAAHVAHMDRANMIP